MAVCHGSSLLSLSDPCIRQFWASLVPAAFVVVFCILQIPVPGLIKRGLRFLQTPFKNFLPLAEAEALNAGETVVVEEEEPRYSVWKTYLISSLSLAETLIWLGLGSYALAVDPASPLGYVLPSLLALSWLYSALRITLKPTSTPPFDLFTLFTVNFVFNLVSVGGILYDIYISDRPIPAKWVLAGHAANFAAVSILLIAILRMPLTIPSKRVDPVEIVRIFLHAYAQIYN